MLQHENRLRSLIGGIVSRWPIVAVAVAVGIALGGVLGWLTMPEPGYVATVTIRYTAPSGVAGAPTADTFAALALDRSVQSTAAAQLDVEPERYIDSVEAAVNPRDGSLINIRVTDPDERVATSMAEALASAAREEALRPVERYTTYYETRIRYDKAILEDIETHMRQLEQQLDAEELEPADRINVEEALNAQRIRRTDALRTLAADEFTLSTYTASAEFVGETSTERFTTTRYPIAGGLQGAVIGLLVGMLVAGGLALQGWDDGIGGQ